METRETRETMGKRPFELVIRQLTEADIPFAMELKNIAGWNQVEADWLGYMKLEPEGCFLAEVNGRKAGTATAIRYGLQAGWIGMVLVHPDLRRYGIGKALLNRTIAYLKGLGVESIKLDATPMGKTVYVPLGFVDEYEIERFQGAAPAAAAGLPASERRYGQADIVPITEELMEEVIDLDAGYFGIRREEALRMLAARDGQYGFCLKEREKGSITGYLMAHQGLHAVQAGPWAADSYPAAEALFEALLSAAPGQSLFLDVPCLNTEGAALMAKFGFTVQRGFSRMYLGSNKHPGQPKGIYGTAGAEKG